MKGHVNYYNKKEKMIYMTPEEKNKIKDSIRNMENANLGQRQGNNKEGSLVERLYNEIGNKKVPRVSDVVQSSYDNLDYVFGYLSIEDCYLLANLISLVKKGSNNITELIKINNNNPNEVYVEFYSADCTEITQDTPLELEVTFKAVGSKRSYKVTLEEALDWKTCHKALWPVVIEIAYVKHLDDVWNLVSEKMLSALGNRLQILCSPDPRKRLGALVSALAMVHLVGGTAVQRIFLPGANKEFKKFATKDYNSKALDLYNLIETKLRNNKCVTASFQNGNKKKIDTDKVASAAISRAKSWKNNPQKFEQLYSSRPSAKYWMDKNKIKPEELAKKSEDYIKDFILDTCVGSEISKTKLGIHTAHEYAVVDVDTEDGYKYVVIRNTHDIRTKIDYRKSIKDLAKIKEVKLPADIPDRNECKMELNHFMKKLASINYGNS